ncbi:hypothetical protein AAF712_016146 [Marasmius tenuissimus]|uniref:Cytochrome P450 n=1 Tax=Marasmius tenuissimus TaxID=585030 RepID=A0ABR2Z6P3_9AGAR
MSSILLSHPIASSGVILGIANHLYFKKHEPVRTAIIRTACFLLLQPALQLLLLHHFASVTISTPHIIFAYLTFFSSIATSIVAYRISPFHPLAKIPGPMIFKISKFWRMYICITGKQHIALKELHDRYGPIVRSGPNDISVIDHASLKAVLGTEGLPKGPAYLARKVVGLPPPLLVATGEEHTAHRRLWSRGFSSESIKEYQEIIISKGVELAEALTVRTGKELDLVEWMNFFTLVRVLSLNDCDMVANKGTLSTSFDFMAEMAFGSKTGMLKHGKDETGIIDLIHAGAWSAEISSQVPWLSYLLTFLPSSLSELRKICFAWGRRRVEDGSKTKDLWYHLSDEEGHEKVKPRLDRVGPDSLSAIVAGSDTTSTAMSNFFWCILSNPEAYKRVVSEVDKEYPPGIDPLLDTSRYGNLKFLRACLNESLRVLPPVPSNGPRVVPKESGGKVICGHFIAEGTQVQVPPLCVHYNPSNFSPSPESFIPERWIPGELQAPASSITMKTDAFIPFSYGPANCVGKNLAIQEMMMILTMLIQRFDFAFAEGFEWEEWVAKKVDAFLTENGPLKVVVRSKF